MVISNTEIKDFRIITAKLKYFAKTEATINEGTHLKTDNNDLELIF
jgi:hypothetical protein